MLIYGDIMLTNTNLIKKLKLKPGLRATILNAPAGYLDELSPLPEGVQLLQAAEGKFDWVQIFVHTQANLGSVLPQALPRLKPLSLLWISYPRGSSKLQTDLTRDKGWDSIQGRNLKRVTLISGNETWSAFGFRPARPGEALNDFMAH